MTLSNTKPKPRICFGGGPQESLTTLGGPLMTLENPCDRRPFGSALMEALVIEDETLMLADGTRLDS